MTGSFDPFTAGQWGDFRDETFQRSGRVDQGVLEYLLDKTGVRSETSKPDKGHASPNPLQNVHEICKSLWRTYLAMHKFPAWSILHVPVRQLTSEQSVEAHRFLKCGWPNVKLFGQFRVFQGE